MPAKRIAAMGRSYRYPQLTIAIAHPIAWWVTRRATLAVSGRSAHSAANPPYCEPIIYDVSAA